MKRSVIPVPYVIGFVGFIPRDKTMRLTVSECSDICVSVLVIDTVSIKFFFSNIPYVFFVITDYDNVIIRQGAIISITNSTLYYRIILQDSQSAFAMGY
ncbi:MAG: hypothetical protein NC453_23960 [Muribaculum sp.]|nr:hypothetical protein [Muribaculum sp.]